MYIMPSHSAAERRHDNEPKPIEPKIYRPEDLKTVAERMKEQQAIKMYSESWNDFRDDLSVGVMMGKDEGKRPGAERGEDMFLADKETGLTGVFDGLGGEGEKGSGANASGISALFAPSLYKIVSGAAEKLPASKLNDELSKVADGQASFEHPSEVAAKKKEIGGAWAKQPVEIQREIVTLYKTVQKLSEKTGETKGMTTVTLGKTVKLADGRMYEIVANVGDSGATRVDAEGRAHDITNEDSAVDQAVSMGFLTRKQSEDPNFNVVLPGGTTRTVAQLRRAMYQALGMPGTIVVPRISVIEMRPGDKIVYATDGIRDEIADAGGNFDAKRAADILNGRGAEALMNEAADGKKKDERTILIKERYLSVDSVEDDIQELPPDALIEDVA